MDARSRQGFPSSCRLRTSREYSRIWRQGRRCHTTHLLVIAAPGSLGVRLGISVSRKVGNAVCRNRLKRWLREYFRRHRAEINSATDLSVVVKPGAGLLEHTDFDQQLLESLRRLRIYDDA